MLLNMMLGGSGGVVNTLYIKDVEYKYTWKEYITIGSWSNLSSSRSYNDDIVRNYKSANLAHPCTQLIYMIFDAGAKVTFEYYQNESHDTAGGDGNITASSASLKIPPETGYIYCCDITPTIYCYPLPYNVSSQLTGLEAYISKTAVAVSTENAYPYGSRSSCKTGTKVTVYYI